MSHHTLAVRHLHLKRAAQEAVHNNNEVRFIANSTHMGNVATSEQRFAANDAHIEDPLVQPQHEIVDPLIQAQLRSHGVAPEAMTLDPSHGLNLVQHAHEGAAVKEAHHHLHAFRQRVMDRKRTHGGHCHVTVPTHCPHTGRRLTHAEQEELRREMELKAAEHSCGCPQ